MTSFVEILVVATQSRLSPADGSERRQDSERTEEQGEQTDVAMASGSP
jgi:hypothetical protein